MTDNGPKLPWIPNIEIEDAKIKWAFSHFGGQEDTFNAEGDHNFQVILNPADVPELMAHGWNIREMPGYEEGDPSEFLLKVKISYRFEDPKIFLIKNNKKYRAEQRDLADIKRATTKKMDLVISPNRWSRNGSSGVTAYCKELYAHIEQSRFADQYDDLEII